MAWATIQTTTISNQDPAKLVNTSEWGEKVDTCGNAEGEKRGSNSTIGDVPGPYPVEHSSRGIEKYSVFTTFQSFIEKVLHKQI